MPPSPFGRTFFQRVQLSYGRFERLISSVSLFGGFAFDALTLKRIDMFWENFWVLGHLLVVAGCIALLNRPHNAAAEANGVNNLSDGPRSPLWLVSVLQFAFGGLLSTFLVYYFRSGSIWVSWPFFLILAAAFLANESLKKHYARLDFQVSFFFLSLFAFAIFIVPVILHRMGTLVFLLSGLVSLALLWLFLRALKAVAPETMVRGRKGLFLYAGAIYVAMNIMYFLNWIPPIPLSLQDADVAHSVYRTVKENFAVETEDPGWFRFFRPAEEFHGNAGDRVYAYTAVFSPDFSAHDDRARMADVRCQTRLGHDEPRGTSARRRARRRVPHLFHKNGHQNRRMASQRRDSWRRAAGPFAVQRDSGRYAAGFEDHS